MKDCQFLVYYFTGKAACQLHFNTFNHHISRIHFHNGIYRDLIRLLPFAFYWQF